MLSRLPLALILYVLVGCSLAFAGVHSPERLESLRDYLQQQVREFRLPGLAVAVVVPGTSSEIVIVGEGISPSSAFVIGSCSKTVTALATLLALGEAGISVDTRLEEVLPAVRFAGQKRSVTIRNLLEHRSGLSRRQGFDRMPALSELKRNGTTLQPVGEPDRKYRYSNTLEGDSRRRMAIPNTSGEGRTVVAAPGVSAASRDLVLPALVDRDFAIPVSDLGARSGVDISHHDCRRNPQWVFEETETRQGDRIAEQWFKE